jgi:hypothetical protein
MVYKLRTTHQFEKDLKRCKKRGLPMDKFKEVIKELVANGKVLPILSHMCYMVTEMDSGSVIYNQIGCLYGNKIIQS